MPTRRSDSNPSDPRRGRRAAAARQQLGPQAGDRLELADEHLRTLALDAVSAAEDLAFEQENLAEAVEDPAEIETLEAIYEAVIEHSRLVAERSSRLRTKINRARTSVPADDREPEAGRRSSGPKGLKLRRGANGESPSDGVVLVARQLALQGSDEREIEAVLESLGVEHADDAVRRSLQ